MKYILKSTIRNFIRKPATNLINLLGLAISLALVIILSVYCYSELTTDHFHKKGDRVYLLSKAGNQAYTPGVLKGQIDLSVPEIEVAVRVSGSWETPVFQVEGHEPVYSDILFADEGFFELYTCKFIEGDPLHSLNEPLMAVLTSEFAEKLFGKGPATGKTFKYNNDRLLTVAAVVEKPEGNSAISFNAVTNIETRKILHPNEGELTEWGWNNFQTFVLLTQTTRPEEASRKIASVVPEDQQKDYAGLQLIPVKKLYFSGLKLYGDGYLRCGDLRKVMILLMVASVVLLVALINFINISASQWHEKIKQTGVMKVIGARRPAIMYRIFTESFFVFLAALVLCAFLIGISMPFIRNYTGIRFNPQLLYSFPFILIALISTFFLSSVFSLIPAVRISSSKAIDNLKKAVSPDRRSSAFMGGLVTSQFVIAIVLIAFTGLVQKQVDFGSGNFARNQQQIVGIKLTQQLEQKKDVLKKLLEEKPEIKSISLCQYYPGKSISHWGLQMNVDGGKRQLDFDTFSADSEFLRLMGLELVQGRFYSDDFLSDEHKVVVKEAFVREHKIANPIGGTFNGWDGKLLEIVAVVKDFRYKPVNVPIVPLAIRNDGLASYCMVNLQTADFNSLHHLVRNIESEAAKLSPSFPVELSFFDQAVEQMYQSELQFRRTFTLFAGCSIVICCMGILAMSLFACQRRIKEIGIRKVNGATVSEVMAMLNKDFVRWVLIAFIVATPIARYAMNEWLENFAYRTTLSWWIFALAGLLASGIALLTVSWQSWKAATKNPVDALRCE